MEKQTALILEDYHPLAELYALALESTGFNTKIMSDGKNVMTWVAQNKPNLIFASLYLPFLSGSEFVTQIQNFNQANKTKIVLSNGDDKELYALQKQVDFVIKRPLTYTELCDLSMRLCQPEA